MDLPNKATITVETTINAPLEKVWQHWTESKHIVNWYHASDDWHAPHAENDLRVDGKFSTHMAALDGSVSFDFEGIYTRVDQHKAIEYTLADDRKVWITFSEQGLTTVVTQVFVPETENTMELQQFGWQAILNNFKDYVEH